MNLRSCLPICTGILALLISSPAWANHVDRPASGHGTDDTCSTGADNCQTFGTAFTASDGLTVNAPFTFDDNPPTLSFLDTLLGHRESMPGPRLPSFTFWYAFLQTV